MIPHELDFRNIFKQLKDINSRLSHMEEVVKDLKSGKGVNTINEQQWRESLIDGDPEE